eukprot:1697929-Rhodomonas_salina.1
MKLGPHFAGHVTDFGGLKSFRPRGQKCRGAGTGHTAAHPETGPTFRGEAEKFRASPRKVSDVRSTVSDVR